MDIAKAFDRVVATASCTALHACFLLLVSRVENETGKQRS
jgi:microcompartment protein CcmK/EutM